MIIEREELREKLRNGELTVVFTKKDGSERRLRCTLQSDVVPETKNSGIVRTDEVLSVYDVENAGWRSFRLDSISEIIL